MFFLGGSTVSRRPDSALVAAKAALLNDQLVLYFTERLLPAPRPAAADKSVSKLVQRHRAAVGAVLGAETGFLAEQLEPPLLENLLINLLVTLPAPELPPVIGHLGAECLKGRLTGVLRLELIFLSFLVQVSDRSDRSIGS